MELGSSLQTFLFIRHAKSSVIYLLGYAYSIIITENNMVKIDVLVRWLYTFFTLKDLGNLHYYFGVEMFYTSKRLLLSKMKLFSKLKGNKMYLTLV